MANEQQSTVSKGGDMVLIGVKLPHGIVAELAPPPREAPDGQVRSPPPCGPRMILKGANSAAQTAALGGTLIRVNPRVLNFGQTSVPRAFWEQWSKQEVAKSFIEKGFVFVVNREADFKAQAREKLPERTGLEGLSPEGNDERMKTIRIPGQPETVVEPDKEHLRRLQSELEGA
jgi:hypothetical protein